MRNCIDKKYDCLSIAIAVISLLTLLAGIALLVLKLCRRHECSCDCDCDEFEDWVECDDECCCGNDADKAEDSE